MGASESDKSFAVGLKRAIARHELLDKMQGEQEKIAAMATLVVSAVHDYLEAVDEENAGFIDYCDLEIYRDLMEQEAAKMARVYNMRLFKRLSFNIDETTTPGSEV